MLSVFVYGTLKPGGFYYKQLCETFRPGAIPAWTSGRLYHLPGFGYPAMTVGEDRIEGYILRFADDTVLPALDELEVYDPERLPEQNMYLRQRLIVQSHLGPLEVWAYLMTEAKVAEYQGIYLPEGNWPHL